jgi:mRNA interferase MazF
MIKEFGKWCEEKQQLEEGIKDTIVFHEREIWWCSMGVNLGDEEDGKNDLFERPAIVLKKFNAKIAWVIPLSSKVKEGKYYHTLIHEGYASVALLSQLRLVSIKRFRRKIRKISVGQFNSIREKIKSLV